MDKDLAQLEQLVSSTNASIEAESDSDEPWRPSSVLSQSSYELVEDRPEAAHPLDAPAPGDEEATDCALEQNPDTKRKSNDIDSSTADLADSLNEEPTEIGNSVNSSSVAHDDPTNEISSHPDDQKDKLGDTLGGLSLDSHPNSAESTSEKHDQASKETSLENAKETINPVNQEEQSELDDSHDIEEKPDDLQPVESPKPTGLSDSQSKGATTTSSQEKEKVPQNEPETIRLVRGELKDTSDADKEDEEVPKGPIEESEPVNEPVDHSDMPESRKDMPEHAEPPKEAAENPAETPAETPAEPAKADEPDDSKVVYLFVSFASGGRGVMMSINMAKTILESYKIPYTIVEISMDDRARRLWKYKGIAKGKRLPAVFRDGDLKLDYDGLLESNESEEVEEVIYDDF